MAKNKHLLFLPEFRKFITASRTGRRLMPSGKKIRKTTIRQYEITCRLVAAFEKNTGEQLEILLSARTTHRQQEKTRKYWNKKYHQFLDFLYQHQKSYDNYAGAVLKHLKTFLRYLSVQRGLPVGDFYQSFRVPRESFTPVIISPEQLRFLIADKEFEQSLSPVLLKTKDLFVFGCTVGLRFQDLIQLKRTNLKVNGPETSLILNTRKTGTEVSIPLPPYAHTALSRLKKNRAGYLLPGISGTNFNKQVKLLIKAAGWNYYHPKYRLKRGERVEIKTREGNTYRFYDHITAHTMRRTAITTLLLLGVDENAVRRISGHAPGSKEFYRYVVISQDYLNKKVREAHRLLMVPETDPIST